MTVCIASIFHWNYAAKGAEPSWGTAAIALSDRMLTAGDVQYEPSQMKVCFIAPLIMVMIAGDYALHTQALKDTASQLKGISTPTPHDVAVIYGRAIQGIKRKQAEDLYLAPLGLNTDTFLAQQKGMSESFINTITSQLQNYRGDEIEAIVVGSSNQIVQLYTVDSNGVAHCHDDLGFAAIGIGAWHAKSQLMQSGYVNRVNFANALAATYAAKKVAELSPGVGAYTDTHLIMRHAVFPLWPKVADKLADLYTEFLADRTALGIKSVRKLQEYIDSGEAIKKDDNGGKGQNAGADKPIDGGINADATKATRKDGSQEGNEDAAE